MRKGIFPLLAAFLCVTACAQVLAETQGLSVFENKKRGLKIFYPEGWHPLERARQHPYLLTIEPTAPAADSAAVSLTVEMVKFYHVSSAGFNGTNEEILSHYFEKLVEAGKAKVLRREDRNVQGRPARFLEMKATDPRLTTPLRVLTVACVKDDVLAAVLCQAPDQEIETYRPLFSSVLDKVEPFSSDPAQPDNQLIDQASGEFEAQAIEAVNQADAGKAVALFQQAIRMNPGNLFHRMKFGSILLQMAKNPSGEVQPKMMEAAEKELQIARKFLETSGDPRKGVLLSQVLYLLGEVAYQGRQDREGAKALYEEALRYYPHDEAKEALKRYEGS